MNTDEAQKMLEKETMDCNIKVKKLWIVTLKLTAVNN